MAKFGKTLKIDWGLAKSSEIKKAETRNIIAAIAETINLRLQEKIASREPKNAMENLQRSLYKN